MWTDPWIVLLALMLEAAISYPLTRLVPHPVTWIGAWIGAMEQQWNRGYLPQRAFGLWTLVLLVLATGVVGYLIQRIAGGGLIGAGVVALVGTLGLAQRSLFDHVRAVQAALEAHDLPAARAAVSRIVGRDVDQLDEAGIAKAAIESLAESFNDGIIAPALWFALAGLPGLFVYKAVNTADSMIGHRETRYAKYGWAAARLDDLMNLIPARIAGILLCVATWRGFAVMIRDAGKHASPNAGWPEAAMAGALGVRLGGPVAYDGVPTNRPTFGDGPAAGMQDLARALRLYLIACGLTWILLLMGGFAWPR